jgi:hypothetical protein
MSSGACFLADASWSRTSQSSIATPDPYVTPSRRAVANGSARSNVKPGSRSTTEHSRAPRTSLRNRRTPRRSKPRPQPHRLKRRASRCRRTHPTATATDHVIAATRTHNMEQTSQKQDRITRISAGYGRPLSGCFVRTIVRSIALTQGDQTHNFPARSLHPDPMRSFATT